MKKRQLKATRVHVHGQWQAVIGKNLLKACSSDVEQLFAGVAWVTECFFEITTRRPRTPDYHRFDWVHGSYHTTDETIGNRCLMSDTASKLRRSMGFANTIYVSVYTEE
jgi:hypothetical protein